MQENIPYATSDAIATVETDKAMVEIEAEEAGVILRFLVEPGTEVHIGAPIAVTGAVGETVEDLDAALRDLGAAGRTPRGANRNPGRPQSLPRSQWRPPTASPAALFATPLVRRLAQAATSTWHA